MLQVRTHARTRDTETLVLTAACPPMPTAWALVPDQAWHSAGAEAISPCLQQLQEADLSSCGIGAPGAVHLAVPLAAPGSRLRVLRLSGNQLGPAGAQSLGQAVSCSPALEELYLADCNVQCKGGIWHRQCPCSAAW